MTYDMATNPYATDAELAYDVMANGADAATAILLAKIGAPIGGDVFWGLVRDYEAGRVV